MAEFTCTNPRCPEYLQRQDVPHEPGDLVPMGDRLAEILAVNCKACEEPMEHRP